jgi:two-component system OmpR family sensor kinase
MFSFRFKLTFYYLAILTIILSVVGIASYLYLTSTIQSTIDTSLSEQIDRIEHHMALAAGIEPSARTRRHEDLVNLTPHLTQIIDMQGRVVDEVLDSPRYGVTVDIESLRRIGLHSTVFSSVTTEDHRLIRLATRRVQSHSGTDPYFIRSGQSLETLNLARRQLLVLLAMTIPVALLLGSFGGLILAHQALRPVDRIRRTAERINGGDLTERVPVPERMDEIGRLAATFNQMIARLQAAFERQKQFTSDASHELRTPLAIMRGDIEVTLRRERTFDEYQRVLGSTLDEIVRLSRLVEDLLLLTRADIGKIELQCRPVNLSQLCRDLIDYINPLARQRGQQLLLTADPVGEDLILVADEQRLRQLLLNLVDNAIKYTDRGGRIELALARKGGEIIIRVIDNGRGIPAADLPRIFDRFFRRSKMAGGTSAPGTGLGLSISKWIVESHGGTIGVQSRPGHGTEFTVTIEADGDRSSAVNG